MMRQSLEIERGQRVPGAALIMVLLVLTALVIVGTPFALATSIHSSRLISPFGSALLRKNIMAVFSLIAFSSSALVSTHTVFVPASRICAS